MYTLLSSFILLGVCCLQTAVLALQPSLELPEGLGATWFDVVDQKTGDFVDPEQRLINDSILEASQAAFAELSARLRDAGWELKEVTVLGHGQGGTVALNVGFRQAFNAVVSIGGP